MNDYLLKLGWTRVQIPPAPQDMKKLIKLLKMVIDNSITEKKKIVIVYSADTNKIDEDGGPYKVEVTDVQQKTR